MQTPKENLPTKGDLLSRDLVTMDHFHRDVTTNSLKVAEKFGKRPADVNRRIANLIKKHRCKAAPIFYRDKYGREQKCYELDREAFSVVVLGFTGSKAEKFRVEYVRMFERMLGELAEWRQTRKEIKPAAITLNAAIQLLQTELSKEIPDSSKPDKLYLHVNRAQMKKVTGTVRTSREELTFEQLLELDAVDQKTADVIAALLARGDIAATKIRDKAMFKVYLVFDSGHQLTII